MSEIEQEIKELVKSVSDLVTEMRLVQRDNEYFRANQEDFKKHIEYAKPILAKSKSIQAIIDSVIMKAAAALIIAALLGLSYNSFKPAEVKVEWTKKELARARLTEFCAKARDVERCKRESRIANT